MQRRQVLFGVLGLMLAAVAARADIPQQITLLGQKYAVTTQPLAVKWKNGLTVMKPDDGTHMAGGITFVQGATPDKDRLFVTTAFNGSYAGNADQFFLLTGADPSTGEFNPKVSNLTQFFGGSVDMNRGGRIANVTFISDDQSAGPGKNLNFALNTFTGPDYLRFYDESSLTGSYTDGNLLKWTHRTGGGEPTVTDPDPNMPSSGFIQGAPGPAGALVFMGRGDDPANMGPQLSLFDPKQKKWLNSLTNVGTATANKPTPYDNTLDPWDIEQIAGNDYLLLGSNPADLNANPTNQGLYRVTLTFPTDLSQAKPEGIGVQVKGFEEFVNTDSTALKNVLGLDYNADVFGVASIALGRPVGGDNGPRRLYIRTRDGILITANPTP